MTDAPDRREQIARVFAPEAWGAFGSQTETMVRLRAWAFKQADAILALPDPRIAELEAKVARLEGALRHAHEVVYTQKGYPTLESEQIEEYCLHFLAGDAP